MPDYPTIVQAIIVAIIPILVYGFRQLIPRIPRVVVWSLPLLFGGIIEALTSYIQTGGVNVWQGVLLGALAMVLREFVSTLREHGTQP